MLRMPITYKDLDDNEITEVFLFNLTKTEVIRWELANDKEESIGEYIQGVVKRGKGSELMAMFDEFLERSYGVRGEDGKRLMKGPEIYKAFTQTAAYDVFFSELCTNATAAAEFINAIFPEEMREAVAAAVAAGEDGEIVTIPAPDDLPAYKRENREPTKQELMEMSREEMVEAMSWKTAQRQVAATPETEAPSE